MRKGSLWRMYLPALPSTTQLDRAFAHFLAGRPYRLRFIIRKEEEAQFFASPSEPASLFENWSHWQFVRAASTGDARLLDQLVDAGLHKYAKAYETSEGPLGVAARYGWQRGVERLAECGVDLEATDYRGRTALLLAAKQGAAEAVRSLLCRGAKFAVCNEGNSAMHFAAAGMNSERALETLKVLILGGANGSALNKEGATPMALATRADREDTATGLAKLLEDSAAGKLGAAEHSLSSVDDEMTMSTLDEAWALLLAGNAVPFGECVSRAGLVRRSCDSGFRSCLTPLCEWAARQIEKAAEARDERMLSTLVRHQMANWAWLPETDENALHLVAKKNWAAGVGAIVRVERHLLEHASDHFGTPLHAAVTSGADASLREMLALGADPNSMDRHGRTPLHVFRDVSTAIECSMCEALLLAGAHPGEVSEEGDAVAPNVIVHAQRFIKMW